MVVRESTGQGHNSHRFFLATFFQGSLFKKKECSKFKISARDLAIKIRGRWVVKSLALPLKIHCFKTVTEGAYTEVPRILSERHHISLYLGMLKLSGGDHEWLQHSTLQ